MYEREKESLVQRYVRAYDDFDSDGMMALMHPECRIQNVSSGEVNASTTGVQQLRELAENQRTCFLRGVKPSRLTSL